MTTNIYPSSIVEGTTNAESRAFESRMGDKLRFQESVEKSQDEDNN